MTDKKYDAEIKAVQYDYRSNLCLRLSDRYGAAPCPVCQSKRRKGLIVGTLEDHCPRPRKITIKMSGILRMSHDKTDFTDKIKCDPAFIGSYRETLGVVA